MESLRQNKPLLWSIVGAIGGVLILVSGISPELSESFSLIQFPDDVSSLICC